MHVQPPFNYCSTSITRLSVYSSIVGNFTNITVNDSSQAEDQENLYKILCPPLILGCLMSVVLNSCLMIIGHLGTRNKSPVLILSLNLASTDTLASFFNGITFLINSYLPVVYNVRFTTCPILVLEMARISAFISSVLHLLALAFIHYRGIVRPLHYRLVLPSFLVLQIC